MILFEEQVFKTLPKRCNVPRHLVTVNADYNLLLFPEPDQAFENPGLENRVSRIFYTFSAAQWIRVTLKYLLERGDLNFGVLCVQNKASKSVVVMAAPCCFAKVNYERPRPVEWAYLCFRVFPYCYLHV